MCEAQQTRDFEYLDEQSINDELKCSICTDPFIDPVVTTSCDHTFCRSCIESALKKKSACPDCRHEPLSSGELKPSGRILVNLLNGLIVTCESCSQTNIQRGLFDEHIKKSCPKVNVTCPAADLKCRWTGSRDQLSSHLVNCTFESMRPILGQFILITERLDQSERENQQLKLQVADLEQRCHQHKTKIQQLEVKTNRLEQQCTQLIAKMDEVHTKVIGTFGSIKGSLVLSDNNCVVTKTGDNEYATCRCTNRFYSGTHIHWFAFEQLSTSLSFLFGVISATAPETKTYYDAKSVYGWAMSGNYVIQDGMYQSGVGGFSDNYKQGDIISCVLDCDKHKIRHTNERTNKTFELDVNVVKCALPWQLCFGMQYNNDYIRFL